MFQSAKKYGYFIMISFAVALFLAEAIILILYRETWLDELNFLWEGYLFTRGELIPFKDLMLIYPPLFIPIYGIGQVLFGPSFYVGRITSAVLFFLILLFVFLIAKKMSNKWWAIGGVFLILSNIFLVGSYISATLYSLAALLMVLVFWVETLSISRKKKAILSAVFLGLAMLTRINMLPAVLIYFIYLYFTKDTLKEIALFLIVFFGIVFVGYLPVILPDPALSLSVYLSPFYKFGLVKNLSDFSVYNNGGNFNAVVLFKLYRVILDLFKEYYPLLLLFFAAIICIALEYRRLKDFCKKEPSYALLVALSIGFLISHYLFWKCGTFVAYSSYFIPLIVLSVVVGIGRLLPNNRYLAVFFILAVFFNFFINSYRTDVVSDPNSESDFERVQRGAAFLTEQTSKDDKILTFDYSIFHIFLADRRTFPPLMVRSVFFTRDPNADVSTVKRLRFYNFDLLKQWFGEADYAVLHAEKWSTLLGKEDEEKAGTIKKILGQNYEFVGTVENVYPRKYTKGKDGGTLELYRRVK